LVVAQISCFDYTRRALERRSSNIKRRPDRANLVAFRILFTRILLDSRSWNGPRR
jgi:hypothetical protein